MQLALIVGSTGLLGSRVARILANEMSVICTHFSSPPLGDFGSTYLNATKFHEIESLFRRFEFDLVVNCAGLTNVEICETRPEAAWQLNATLPYHLAKLTKKYNAKFVQISTDHFNSHLGEPRDESTVMFPVNQYGYTKLAGENFVHEFNDAAIIIRTNFFGLTQSRNHSLLDFLVKKFTANEQITGFTDVVFSPIGVTELAKVIVAIYDKGVSGLIHVTGNVSLTKYEFAQKVREKLFAHSQEILKGLSSEAPGAVRRPLNLALDSSRLAAIIGQTQTSLDEMLSYELSDTL